MVNVSMSYLSAEGGKGEGNLPTSACIQTLKAWCEAVVQGANVENEHKMNIMCHSHCQNMFKMSIILMQIYTIRILHAICHSRARGQIGVYPPEVLKK